ncbi:MAG TPA: hypothetical protein VJB57_03150 [Dehalococcoidia bacterium]|nr:hypothetical protein [Dehalococcoidia bacterium]
MADQWRSETMYISSPEQIASHPNYLQIVAKGYQALPLILRDLEARGGEWYRALRAIAAANHIPTPILTPEQRRNSRLVEQTWIKWGRDHGFIG